MGDNADEREVVLAAARDCSAGLASWAQRLCAKRLGGGTTNRVWLVTADDDDDDDDEAQQHEAVVVRVYGSDTSHLIDREREIAVAEALARVGRVPRVVGRFQGGIVTAFAQGRTLCPQDIALPHFSAMVAAEMARWHAVDCHALQLGPPTVQLWRLLASWVSACQEQEHYHQQQQQRRQHFCDFAEILREAAFLEGALPHGSVSGRVPNVAMCHNDAQSLNVIWNPSTDTCCFIDLEYSSFNTPYFDIGALFNTYTLLICLCVLLPPPLSLTSNYLSSLHRKPLL